MTATDHIYSDEVREQIRNDLMALRQTQGVKLYTEKPLTADDQQSYIVNGIRARIDAFRRDTDPSLAAIRFDRNYVSRPRGLKVLDDDVIDIIIKFIDHWYEGDYQSIVSGYLEADSTAARDTAPIAERPAAEPAFALANFRFRVDRFLTAGPFSAWLLSVHVSFAALYVFFAMAVTWGVGGELQFGNPVLPGGNDGGAERGFDSGTTVAQRFNVLALVLVIVMLAGIGLITAAVRQKNTPERIATVMVLALLAAPVNFAILWASGVDSLFGGAYAAVLSIAVVLSHRAKRREALGYIFPVAILLSVMVAVAASLVRPGAEAPGGILPVAAFLVLVIGGLGGRNRGGYAAAAMAVVFTLFFGVINAVYFPGWFKLDRWDPGTVMGFLILPFLNGFWDWLSLSATRTLSASALKRARTAQTKAQAGLLLVRAALIDTAIAVAFIIGLFTSLELVTTLYNNLLPPGETRAAVTAYFEALRHYILSSHSLFVTPLTRPVILPKLVPAHAVSRAMLGAEMTLSRANLSRWAAYCALMAAVLTLLLLLVRSAIDIVSGLLPTITNLIPTI